MRCGLCWQDCKHFKCLYNMEGSPNEIHCIVARYFELDDLDSATICNDCWSHIDDFDRFKQQIEKVQKQHEKIAVRNEADDQKRTCMDHFNDIVDEVDLVPSEVQSGDNTITDPLNTYQQDDASVKEDIDMAFLDELDTQSDYGSSSEKYSDSSNSVDGRQKNPRADDEKLTRSNQAKKRKKKVEMMLLRSHTNKQKKLKVETELHRPNQVKKIKKNKVRNMDKFIVEQFKERLPCDKCEFRGQSFSELMEHYKEAHNITRGYVVCCERQFQNRWRLWEHLQLHVNPAAFQCEECEKCMIGSRSLGEHMQNVHPEKMQEKIAACERRKYKRYYPEDRSSILECANSGGDWSALAVSLGVNRRTAVNWVTSGKETPQQRGGQKPRALLEEEVAELITWVELNPSITMAELRERLFELHKKRICLTTISKYLEGQIYSMKPVEHNALTINTPIIKQRRADYVKELNRYIEAKRQIIYIDETNFNLFYRRKRGHMSIGDRASQELPAARGPNLHIIGCITANGMYLTDRRRGSFRTTDVNKWMHMVLGKCIAQGHSLAEVVIVCDNAPCHRRLDEVIATFPGCGATLLRLPPNSVMLNPVEHIWPKIIKYVKTRMIVPTTRGPGFGEQQMQYLEKVVDTARDTITANDCEESVKYSTTLHSIALSLNDMPCDI